MADNIKFPEDMMDEELVQYLGEEQEPEKPEEKPKPKASEAEDQEELQEEEQPEKTKEEDSEAEEQEENEEEKPVSRRKQARLDKLEKLFERIQGGEAEEQAPTKPKKPEGINYKDDLDTDEETANRLNEDREKFGQEMYQQGLAQAQALKQQQDAFEFNLMLKTEEPTVRDRYKFMNPDDERFNPEATEAIVKDYLHFVRFDQNTRTAANPVSYLEFVEARMQMAQALAEDMVSETQKNVTKQAANTGLRPSGSSNSKKLDLNKAAADMSNEELDAMIESLVPSKSRR